MQSLGTAESGPNDIAAVSFMTTLLSKYLRARIDTARAERHLTIPVSVDELRLICDRLEDLAQRARLLRDLLTVASDKP